MIKAWEERDEGRNVSVGVGSWRGQVHGKGIGGGDVVK